MIGPMLRSRDRTFRDALAQLRFLLRENLGLLLLMTFLMLAFVASGIWVTGQLSGPRTEEFGQVVRFGAYGREDGDRLLVIVRTGQGQVQQLHADAPSLLRCHAGSRIRLVRRGAVLTVSPRGCTLS